MDLPSSESLCPLWFPVLPGSQSREEVPDLRTDFTSVRNWKKEDLRKGISESDDQRENGLVLELSHLSSCLWRDACNNVNMNNFHARSKFIGSSSLGQFLTILPETCSVHAESHRHMALPFLIKKFCSITSEYFIWLVFCKHRFS